MVAIEAVASHGPDPFNQKSISQKPGVQLLSVDIVFVVVNHGLTTLSGFGGFGNAQCSTNPR